MLSRPTLSKSAVSFSPFASLLVALVELAIAIFRLFYLPRNQHLSFQQAIARFTSFSLSPRQLLATKQAIANLSLFYCSESQHLTFQQAIAHSTSFSLFPGQLLTTKQAIANFNLFSFSIKQSSTTEQAIAGFRFLCLPTSPQLLLEQAIAAVVGQGSLLRFLALCAPDRRVFCHHF
ncbi:MAG: hypothetical protein AB1589_41565 [Cyanobacteriota bacterium]